MIPGRLLLVALRKAASLSVAVAAKECGRRWLLGEVSLQDMYDRAWRRSTRTFESADDGRELIVCKDADDRLEKPEI